MPQTRAALPATADHETPCRGPGGFGGGGGTPVAGVRGRYAVGDGRAVAIPRGANRARPPSLLNAFIRTSDFTRRSGGGDGAAEELGWEGSTLGSLRRLATG